MHLPSGLWGCPWGLQEGQLDNSNKVDMRAWSFCGLVAGRPLCTCVYQPGHPTESRHLLSSPKDHWPPTSYYMSAPFCLLKRTCNTFSSHPWIFWGKSRPDPHILSLPSSPSRAGYNFDLWLCLLTVLWDVTSSSTFDPMSWMVIRGTRPCTLSGIVGTSVIGEEDQSLSSWDLFIWKRVGWTRSVDCKWVSLAFRHPAGGLVSQMEYLTVACLGYSEFV